MKITFSPIIALSALSFLGLQAAAFDYSIIDAGEISLTDVETDITDIRTIFTNELVAVTVSGLEWEENGGTNNGTDLLHWETLVGGSVQASGSFDLSTLPSRELPTSLDVGEFKGYIPPQY